MLSFDPINIEARTAITAFTLHGRMLNCDYAFANMCSWNFLYGSEYAIQDHILFIRFYIEEKGHKRSAYMFPACSTDRMRQAVQLIEDDAKASGHPLLILGVTPESKNILESLFPDSFTYISERDYYDYIYLREDLATLAGKKYQPKRNHVNKFRKSYQYEYLPVAPDIIPHCMELAQKLYEEAALSKTDNDADVAESLAHEMQSITFAMTHFDELQLSGGAIMVDGEIAAFTYGSPINAATFGIHVEKADVRYDGVFSVINQEFASRIPAQYLYVNREEDLGLPGLRKAKLSYHPILLLEKNAAFKRR